MARIATALCLMATTAAADLSQGLSCEGAPDWQLTFEDDGATFDFAGRSTTFSIPQSTQALEAPDLWAYTLVARNDTAIVILRARTDCATGDIQADILTQRGETPIVLTGCCRSTR